MLGQQKNVIVACPECGQKLEYSVHVVVDGATNRYHKLSIMNNQFFELHCDKCGHNMDMIYDFMYVDSEKKYAIYLIDNENSTGANIALQINSVFMREILGEDYRLRIVSTQNDMVEKIQMFDRNLDDHVVELMKLFCLHHASDVFVNNGVNNVNYCLHEGEDAFLLNIGNGEAVASFPDGMYQEVAKSFANEISECESLIVDRTWAMIAMGKSFSYIDNDGDDELEL